MRLDRTFAMHHEEDLALNYTCPACGGNDDPKHCED